MSEKEYLAEEFYPEDLDYEDYSGEGVMLKDGIKIKSKLKPCYNFQSIEFELEIDPFDPKDLDSMKKAYINVLAALKEATDEIIPATSNTNNPDPPSEAQIKLLNKFGCKWTKATTKAQARELINKAIEKAEAGR